MKPKFLWHFVSITTGKPRGLLRKCSRWIAVFCQPQPYQSDPAALILPFPARGPEPESPQRSYLHLWTPFCNKYRRRVLLNFYRERVNIQCPRRQGMQARGTWATRQSGGNARTVYEKKKKDLCSGEGPLPSTSPANRKRLWRVPEGISIHIHHVVFRMLASATSLPLLIHCEMQLVCKNTDILDNIMLEIRRAFENLDTWGLVRHALVFWRPISESGRIQTNEGIKSSNLQRT